MALIDDVTIRVKAGDGGNGGRSFRANFGSVKKRPDGGNGGHGGNIYFQGTTNLNDLSDFRFEKVIEAPNGENGSHKNMDGKKGPDVTVFVPLGTTIIDQNTDEKFEILEEEKPILIAKGGRGAIGNYDEKIDLRTFRFAHYSGGKGEEKELHLVLNLIADVGLIGFPNAGKSSLLTALTNATPKIGNYPFTTLEPNLGVFEKIIIADIPGLIAGASAGKGLGVEFLKHIQKTKVLLHCIDATTVDIVSSYNTIRKEFEAYDEHLLEKKEVIVLTKIDLIEKDQLVKQASKLKKIGQKIIGVSIYDEKSLATLKKLLIDLL